MADVLTNHISSVSPAEFVRTQVEATAIDSVTHVEGPFNPTPFPVKVAIKPRGEDPVDADWRDADWVVQYEIPADPASAIYWARCLVGPAGTGALAKGRYKMWVDVDTGAEHARIESKGTLVVI